MMMLLCNADVCVFISGAYVPQNTKSKPVGNDRLDGSQTYSDNGISAGEDDIHLFERTSRRVGGWVIMTATCFCYRLYHHMPCQNLLGLFCLFTSSMCSSSCITL